MFNIISAVGISSFFQTFAVTCSKPVFLGLKPWYYYLQLDPNNQCAVQNFELLGPHSSILLVILAIIDDLLVIAGLVAVIFAVYAGIKYVMSQGSPDEVAKAQSTLLNALVGLVVAVIAIGLVSYLGSHFGGSTGNAPKTGIDVSILPHTDTGAKSSLVKNLFSFVFGIVGALAVLFVTIGGFKYVMSNGDPQAIVKARNTILYALVGLVIAILGQFFVAFVVARFGS